MKQEEFKKLLLESKFPEETEILLKTFEEQLSFLEMRISNLERKDTK